MMMKTRQNKSALLILGLEVHVGANHRHTIPKKSKQKQPVTLSLAGVVWRRLRLFVTVVVTFW
jgi:hypothetical protein